MTIAHRGTKHRCTSCGAPFYDLERDPVICPKCHTPYVATARVPVKVLRTRQLEAVIVPEEEAAASEEDEVLEHVDEDEDGLPPEDTDQPDHDGEEVRD